MNKNRKSLLKWLTILPFAILLGYGIASYLQMENKFFWVGGFVMGVVISVFWILYQINEYEAIDKISNKDFLETSHQKEWSYDEKYWTRFRVLLKAQMIDIEIFDNAPTQILARFDQVEILLKKKQENIQLSVKNMGFNYSPDNGANYRILTRIVQALEEK